MYKEKWKISAVHHVDFTGEDGNKINGYQVFYSRDLYENENADEWLFAGRVAPRKPQWLDVNLCKSLMNALASGSDVVFACYEPRGRYNTLVSFDGVK